MNTCRATTIAIRAFLASQCDKVRLKRGKIGNSKPAIHDHEFRLDELRQMLFYADARGKVILSVGTALGWGDGDFLKLRWSVIEPFLREPFVGFYCTCHKTDVIIRGHLTPEACESLRNWRRLNPDAEFVIDLKVHHLNKVKEDGGNGGDKASRFDSFPFAS